MGLIDTIVTTAITGYVTFRTGNYALERIFFSRSASRSAKQMLSGSLKDQLRVINNPVTKGA